MRFSDNLRNLRLDRKMTQMKLAEGLETSQSAITSWERGTREPDFRTIQRIADFFGVPLSALLPYSDEGNDDTDRIARIVDSMRNDPELCLLFDEERTLLKEDVAAIRSVVRAIKGKRDE